MKIVLMILIVNLVVCDLIIMVLSIMFDLFEYEFGYWFYGGVFCKMIWLLVIFFINVVVLIFVVILVDRYILIVCFFNL